MSLKSYVLSAIQDVLEERLGVTVSTDQQSQAQQDCNHGVVNPTSHIGGVESRYDSAENSSRSLAIDHDRGEVQQSQHSYAIQSSDIYSREVNQLHMKTATASLNATNYVVANMDRNIYSPEHGNGNYGVGQQITCGKASGTPSILPIPNFNAMQDAETLQNLIYTANKSTSISFLCGRSSFQRQEISKAYQSMYGKDLVEVLISQLDQESKAIVFALLEPVAVYDAKQLHKAILGTSTQDSVLIECMTYMTLRSDQQLAEIGRMYRQLYHKDLGDELLHDKHIGLQHHLAFLCASGETEEKSQNTDNAILRDNLITAGRFSEDTTKTVSNNDKNLQNSGQTKQIMDSFANVTDVAVLSKVKELDNSWAVANSHASKQDLNAMQITASAKTVGFGDCDHLRIETMQNTDNAEVNSRSSDQPGRKTNEFIVNSSRSGYDSRNLEHLDIQATQTNEHLDIQTETNESDVETASHKQHDIKSVQISNESHGRTIAQNSSQLQFSTTHMTGESYTGKSLSCSGHITQDGAEKDKELHIIKPQGILAESINESSDKTASFSSGQVLKTTQVSDENRKRMDSHSTSQIDVKAMWISSESHTGTDSHSGEHTEAKAVHISGEAQDGKELHITGYKKYEAKESKEEGQLKNNALTDYMDVQTTQVNRESQNIVAAQNQLNEQVQKTTQISDKSYTKEGSHSGNQFDIKTMQVEHDTRAAAEPQSDNQLTSTTQFAENQIASSQSSCQVSTKKMQVSVSGNCTEANSRNYSQVEMKTAQVISESLTEKNLQSISQFDARSSQSAEERNTGTSTHGSNRLDIKLMPIISESQTGTDPHSGSQVNVEATQISSDNHNAFGSRTTGTKDVEVETITLSGYSNAQTNQSSRSTCVETTSFSNEHSVTVQFSGESCTKTNFQSSQNDAETQVTAGSCSSSDSCSNQINIKSTLISNKNHAGENSQSNSQLDLKTRPVEGDHQTAMELQNRHFDNKTTQTADENHMLPDSQSNKELQISSVQLSGELRIEANSNISAAQEQRVTGRQKSSTIEIEGMSKSMNDVQVGNMNMQTDQYSKENYLGTASFSSEETMPMRDGSSTGRDSHSTSYYDTDIRDLVGDSHKATEFQGDSERDIKIVQTGIQNETDLYSSSQYGIKSTQNTIESCTEKDSNNTIQLNVSAAQTSGVYLKTNSFGSDCSEVKTAQIGGKAQDGTKLHIIGHEEGKIAKVIESEFEDDLIGGHTYVKNQFSREDCAEKSYSSDQSAKITQVSHERNTEEDSHSSSRFDMNTMQVKGGCCKTAESHGDIQITQTRQITAENRTETNSQSSGKLDIKTMQISGGQMGTDLHTSIQTDIKATQNIAESCTCANASGNDHLLASQSNSTAQVGKDLHITSYQESGNTGAIEESQSKTEEFCGYLYVHTGHVAGKSRTETTSSSSGISMETEMFEQNRVDIDSNLHSSGQLDVKSAPVSGESSMGTRWQSKSLDIETSHKTTEGRKQTDTNSHSNQIDIKGTSENYIGTDSHSSRQLDVKVMHLSGESHTETNLHGSGQLNIRSTQNTSENRTETELCKGVYRDAGQQISRAQAEKELGSTDHKELKTTVDGESQLEVDAFGGSLDTHTNQSSCESRTETKTVSSEQSVKTVQFGDESRTAIDAHSSSQLDAGVMQISGDRNSGTDLQSSSKLDVKSMQITSESHIDADTHNIQFNVRTTEISGECNKGTGTQSEGLDMKTTQIGKERTTADFHSSKQHDIISAEHTGLTGTNSQNTNQLDIKTTQTDEKHCTGSCGSVQLQIKTTQVTDGTLPEADLNRIGQHMRTTLTGEAQNLRKATCQEMKSAQNIETNQHFGESCTQVGSYSKTVTADFCDSTCLRQTGPHIPTIYVKEESSRVGGFTTVTGELRDTVTSLNTSEYCSSESSSGTVSYSFKKLSLSSDDKFFDEILKNRNTGFLQNVLAKYQRENNQTVDEAIDSQFTGYVRNGLHAAIDVVRNRPAYFAKQLHQCLESHGTRDEDLLRLIVSRSEFDMVDIRRQFSEMYHASLESMIKANCSIVYRDTLIALVNGNNF